MLGLSEMRKVSARTKRLRKVLALPTVEEMTWQKGRPDKKRGHHKRAHKRMSGGKNWGGAS